MSTVISRESPQSPMWHCVDIQDVALCGYSTVRGEDLHVNQNNGYIHVHVGD